MRSLYQIALEAGTDKIDRQHRFHGWYERHFGDRRTHELTLLEIGILKGASHRLWREYFPNARILGIDNRAGTLQNLPKGVEGFVGDQSDPSFLRTVIEAAGGFDIVIDDGCHQMTHQKAAFQYLFPHVNPGGFYVIEDIGTSYRPRYGGGPIGMPGTTIEMVKRLIADLDFRFGHQEGRAAPADTIVAGIHFYMNIVFIERGE